MAYVGKFNHQLDQKNRLRIPAKLKAELGQNFAIVRGTNNRLFRELWQNSDRAPL